jgi:serine/threonine protein kinase
LTTQPGPSACHVGHYSVIGEIGRTAFGLRYHAVDTKNGRDALLLVLSAPPAGAAEALQRWYAAIHGLSHPGLAHVYEMGSADGTLFIAYEYVAGRALDHTFGETGMVFDPETVLSFGQSIAATLEYLHRQHMLHQNLAPGNIWLGSAGRIVLLDVGLARFLQPVPAPGAYVAPEVSQGERGGVTADVYSLGALMYRLFCGREPGHDEDEPGVWAPSAWPGAARVLARALDERPERRYPSAAALVSAFDRALEQPRYHEPEQPRRRFALFVALVVVAMALAFALLVWPGGPSALNRVFVPAVQSVTAQPAAPTLTPAATAVAPSPAPVVATNTPQSTNTITASPVPVTRTRTPAPTATAPSPTATRGAPASTAPSPTRTAIATATSSPIATRGTPASTAPSPTRTAVAATASPTLSPARTPALKIGATVVVANTGGASVRVREQPSTSAALLRVIPEGMRLTIVDGPVRADNLVWWKVHSADGGADGCVAEQFLQAVPSTATR